MTASTHLTEQRPDATQSLDTDGVCGATLGTSKDGRGATSVRDLPEEALRDRLKRNKRKAREQAYAELGISDPAKHRQDMEELQRLRKERDERERKSMTSEQALNADLAKERELRAALERELGDMRRANSAQRQEVVLQEIAGRYLTPKGYKYARVDFLEYLQGLTKNERARLSQPAIARWFQGFARDNPEVALGASGANTNTGAPPKEPPKQQNKQPAARQVRRQAPPPTVDRKDPSVVNGKTVLPGKVNSMTKKEVNELAESIGLSARI